MNIIEKLLILILVTGIFSSGCAILEKPILGAKKRTPQSLTEKPIVADALLKKKVERLSSRIREYRALERRLKKEGKSDSKALADLRQSRQRAEGLVKTYREFERFQRRLLEHRPYFRERKIYRKTIEKLFEGLTGLEEEYFEDRDRAWFTEEQPLKRYKLEIKEIEGYCDTRDYPKVIESYKGVKAIYGECLIPVNIRLCYADALSNMGQVEEAIEVAEGVIYKESLDSIEIRSNLIDWYLKIESPEKALENLEELSDELDREMDIFLISRKRVTSLMDGESGKSTPKLLGDDVVEEEIRPTEDKPKEVDGRQGVKEDERKKDSAEEIEEWEKVSLDEVLEKANNLMNERRFEEARGILVELRESTKNHQEIGVIEDALEALRFEEDRVKEEEEEERFMLAKKLMESEKYEEAIKELNELKDSERYGQESQEMIKKSVDEFAGKKREKAAKLFLMAKKTTDSTEKKELLSRSFELLKEVIKKYPMSSYSAKIIRNIEAVKEEILKIDPHFSEEDSKPD